MAPSNPRVVNAFLAMRDIGISEETVKPVLKDLYKLYDKNWELIEQENYRALADAIFEYEDAKAAEQDAKQSAEQAEQKNKSENIVVHQEEELEEDDQVRPLKRLRLRFQDGQPSQPYSTNVSQSHDSNGNESNLISSHAQIRDKGKEPISDQIIPGCIRLISERSNHALQIKVPKLEPGITILPKQKVVSESRALISPKDEPFVEDVPHFDLPIAVVYPEPLSNEASFKNRKRSDVQEPHASENLNGENTVEDDPVRNLSRKTGLPFKRSDMPNESTPGLDIATSSSGEERSIHVTSSIETLIKSPAPNGSFDVHLNGSGDQMKIDGNVIENGYDKIEKDMAHKSTFHDISDITRGEERVKIPWVNEINDECPPSFRYISQNLIFQNASVKFSLAQIGVVDCCFCIGNCLSSSIPCVCAHRHGCDFDYTLGGLVKEEILQECKSMNRDPQHHHTVYCEECPLERLKIDNAAESCRGHLVRKFIKECWIKCTCHKQCGNRLVQRGITCNLQVFFTQGKGWGLRTREDLPKGSFVCELVGEILTSKELCERKAAQNSENDAYVVSLDADWSSKVLKDDESALYLDARGYGNAARFINHRCLDANLVYIPVEVETSNHHYYHFAFFTARKINAWEELTWDYGIDFEDQEHPVMKTFCCLCGSEFCRNMRREDRSKRTRN